MVDRNNRIALRQIVTESARIGSADGPLRPIAILQRFGGMRFNFAGPVYSTHTRQRFAQDLDFELYLRLVRRLLVVAPAAGSEVWAHRLYARRIRFQNFSGLSPH